MITFDLIFIIISLTVNTKSSVSPILKVLKSYLPGIVKSCLLFGDRAIAHKAAKLLITALE